MKILSILFTSVLLFTSCSNDDNPIVVNEEEVITTLTATLTPVDTGSSVTLQIRDLDGDGPGLPVISGGTLAANTVYNASLVLLNETESPAESINEEIEEEDHLHQFFYEVSNNLASFDYTDTDRDGNPIGLTFTVTTSSITGTGSLTITLRHEPNKSAAGVSDGDITNAGGETDIEAVFPITVQ